MFYPSPEAFSPTEMEYVLQKICLPIFKGDEVGFYQALAVVSYDLHKLYLPQVEDLLKILRIRYGRSPSLLAVPIYMCRERQVGITAKLPHTGDREYPYVLIAEWRGPMVALRSMTKMGVSPDQNCSNLRVTGLGRADNSDIPLSRSMLMAAYN